MTAVRPRLAAVRRAIGVAAVLFILGCAVVFYRVAPGFPTAAAPSPTVTAGSAGPSATQPTRTGSTKVATPSQAPPQSLVPQQSESTTNRSPMVPGANSVGIYLSAVPAADGSFDVAESVILQEPINTLQLRMPPISEGGSTFRTMQPRATAVQVSVGGQPVAVPGGQITGDVSLQLAAPTNKLRLRYRLTGVSVRTVGSVPGRALGALGPIVAGVPPDLPVAITVRGRTVLNLRCPHLSIGQEACSARSDGRLRVKRILPWRQSLIVVQFNLPRP
jgi:hypothetical protein